MSELWGGIWSDEMETPNHSRRPGKQSVKDMKVWLDCYVRMVVLLVR
jgi:hypothetical protein